jgi:putative long chain acyl-CoA synthase
VKTARGPVFTQPIVDVLNEITAVDTEIAYGRKVGGRTLMFAAVRIRPGFELDVDDITEALRGLEPVQRPDIVYVVADIPVSPSYRPDIGAVRAGGLPKVGDRTWCYDRTTGSYRVLTEPAAAGMFGETHDTDLPDHTDPPAPDRGDQPQ